MPTRRRRKRNFNYITILRGIATLGVSFFHLFPQRIKGGFLGVVMFFLMSGFFMMRGLDRPDPLDSTEKLKATYKSRFLKLLPPLYTIMVVGLGIGYFYFKPIFTDSIKSALPVAFGYQNIYQILAGGSYFQRNGNFSIFTHLWYIALQVQYILIFYGLNYFLEKKDYKDYRREIFGGLTIISFVAMYILAVRKASITRIYYGPITRMSALFLGSLLYLEKDRFEGFFKNLGLKKSKNLVLGLLILSIIPFFFVNGESYSTYKIFMVLYTILVGFLVLGLYLYEKILVIDERQRTRIRIGTGFLYYLGSRSYHIYLWQYMVQIFFSYYLAARPGSKLGFYILELLIVIILSELTFNIFEKRFNKRILMAIMVFLMTVMVFASNFIEDTKDQDMKDLEAKMKENQAQIEEDNKKALGAKIKNKTSKKSKISKKNSKNKDKYDFNFTEEERKYLENISVTAIGDSVLINVNTYLREYIPNLYMDAEVGRDMVDGPDILRSIENNQGLGDYIIIALGSNGNLEKDDFNQIMEVAGDREVLFVNTSHTQPWQNYVNKEIANFCQNTENAYLVDWYSYAKEKPELFAQDLVHPNVEGSEIYAKIVVRAIINAEK